MVELLRVRLPWLWAALGLIAVLVFWNIYPVGGSLLGDVLLTWAPALLFVAITIFFLGLAQRGIDKAKRQNEERLDRIERHLERIVELLDNPRDR